MLPKVGDISANEKEIEDQMRKKIKQDQVPEMLGNDKLPRIDSVKDGMQVRLEKQEAGLPIA